MNDLFANWLVNPFEMRNFQGADRLDGEAERFIGATVLS
jgi:hypothetical protein